MIDGSKVGIGDVLCTRSSGWPMFFIRLGAALLDKPNLHNHVLIVHHRDDSGTLWGIEGRPGGVGYVDVRHYLTAPYTLSNHEQPKTEAQRYMVAKVAEGLLGTPYDWEGIVQDGMEAIHAPILWHSKWGDAKVPPAHVVCSSFADWVYDKVGLPSPGKLFDRNVSPADWADFIFHKAWKYTAGVE